MNASYYTAGITFYFFDYLEAAQEFAQRMELAGREVFHYGTTVEVKE